MAVKPYQEGTTWSFRLRLQGQSIYRTGFSSAAAARRESDRLRQKILEAGEPKHGGPWSTSLGQGLQQYGLERLPHLKGAKQEADRINQYLLAAGLATVKVTKPSSESAVDGVFFEATLAPPHELRKIPQGLHEHRQRQAERSDSTDRHIRRLAKMPMAQIMTHHIQDLIYAMQADGYKPATIGLERALLRQVFNFARKNWHWVEPSRNPASGLNMPKIDNVRDRILTNLEWQKIGAELENSRNPYTAPAIALLLETAMRVSEPLLHATWEDVDWTNCLLRLKTAKAGARDVPLSPEAMDILRTISNIRQENSTDPRILPITYEALKASWNRACKATGVEDAHLHDLRHTAATRFTLTLNGNLPVLQVITGHKTFSQLSRYINVKPEDVSRLLHGRPLTEENAPAGLRLTRAELVPPPKDPGWSTDDLPENVVPLRPKEVTRGT